MQKQQKIDPNIQHILVKQKPKQERAEFWKFDKEWNDFPEDSYAA